MKKTTKIIVSAIAFTLAIALLIVLYLVFKPSAEEGSKSITISVVIGDDVTVYELKTDAEYLREAMDEAEGLTYSGAMGQYGIMIDTVNGVYAEYTATASYWAFYVNGEYCNYGIDEQPVYDNDSFEIVCEEAGY